jgi:cob(I)alamin adenosyltransferase
MKIYTKTGDSGDTGLFGGPRVPKDDLRIEAYGTVDELNAQLGLARSESLPPDVDALLGRLQNELFVVGAELATPQPHPHVPRIEAAHVAALEQAIDQAEAQLPPLREFILPGGTRAAALLHVARAVCRRAERRVVRLSRREGENVSPQVVVYLNRLSDLLFVLARQMNAHSGQGDVAWQKPSVG